jgi:hypothetical protein
VCFWQLLAQLVDPNRDQTVNLIQQMSGQTRQYADVEIAWRKPHQLVRD